MSIVATLAAAATVLVVVGPALTEESSAVEELLAVSFIVEHRYRYTSIFLDLISTHVRDSQQDATLAKSNSVRDTAVRVAPMSICGSS